MRIKEILNPFFGKAFNRISDAFHEYLPNTEWVDSDYDYILLYTIGGGEYDVFQTLEKDKVINFQACYLTAGLDLERWQQMWKECHATISFYDLDKYSTVPINHFKTPLGADPRIFSVRNTTGIRPLKVFSTGHVAETECLDKVYDACVKTNNLMIHTGENFKWSLDYYKFLDYMPIENLSNLFNYTKYVTGLRTYEGFELACIEGAMCGATPIVLDLPSYEYYKDFALFVDPNKDITSQLVDIFSGPYTPLTKDQITYVTERFSWERIISDLYKAVF